MMTPTKASNGVEFITESNNVFLDDLNLQKNEFDNINYDKDILLKDIYTPNLRKYEKTSGSHFDHLDVVTTWKAISVKQGQELLFWRNAFKGALENQLLFYKVQGQYLSSPKKRTHLDSTYSTPFLEMPDVLSLKLNDIISDMVKFWDEAGRSYNWLSENDNLEDNLQSLLATSDSCSLDKSMNSVMQLQLSSDTNDRDSSTLMSRLRWNPPLIQFEDLQTVAVEGSRFRLNPSCSFTRVQSSQSCIQYQIQTDCCWLHWRSDSRSYEGIVPSCPVQSASHNYCELSYIVTAIIATSLPKGVIFERIVRCQLSLRVIRADNHHKNGENEISAINDFRKLSSLPETLNYTNLPDHAKRDYFEICYGGDSEISRSRKSITGRYVYSSESKSRRSVHLEPIKPYQDFGGLRSLLPKKLLDQDRFSAVNKARSVGRSNSVKNLEQELHFTNSPKRRDYTDDVGAFSYITQSSPRMQKRMRHSRQNKKPKHSQSEHRSSCSRGDPRATTLHHLRRKSLSSEDIDFVGFLPPHAYFSRLDVPFKRKAERYAYSPYQEKQLNKSMRENVAKNTSRDLGKNRSGLYVQRSNDDAKRTSISQQTEARDMVSCPDRALLDNLDFNAWLYQDWNSERCFKSSKPSPTRITQLHFHQSSSGKSDEMSIDTSDSFSINHPCIPLFPKSISMSSGSSAVASVFTRSTSAIDRHDNDHFEEIGLVSSKEPTDSSSPLQSDCFYDPDTSEDENFVQQPPQHVIPLSENNGLVSNNLKIRNKEMRDAAGCDKDGNAKSKERQRTPADSRPTEVWPKPVITCDSTALLIDSIREATDSYSNFSYGFPQSQSRFGNGYRCDTPMITVTHESSTTTSRPSSRADTGPSQHAITRLQKKYQDNYAYFASLKACGMHGASQHAVRNENNGDDAEDKVYESIFLETDEDPL